MPKNIHIGANEKKGTQKQTHSRELDNVPKTSTYPPNRQSAQKLLHNRELDMVPKENNIAAKSTRCPKTSA